MSSKKVYDICYSCPPKIVINENPEFQVQDFLNTGFLNIGKLIYNETGPISDRNFYTMEYFVDKKKKKKEDSKECIKYIGILRNMLLEARKIHMLNLKVIAMLKEKLKDNAKSLQICKKKLKDAEEKYNEDDDLKGNYKKNPQFIEDEDSDLKENNTSKNQDKK